MFADFHWSYLGIVVVVAVTAVGFYFWRKNRRSDTDYKR
jgi:Na+/proline symporter